LLKALIFDFDGLILDTETPDMQAWQAIFADYGQSFSINEWGQIVGGSGNSDYDPARHLESLVGHGLDRHALNLRARRDSDLAILQQPVQPGARELIAKAQKVGLRLAIASSSRHDWVDTYLQRLGLFDYFEFTVCGDDVQRTKPDPQLYLLALKSLGVTAMEALALEDSPNGIRSAQQAGLFTVAVPIPLTRQLGVEHANLLLDSLEEVQLDKLQARFI